MNRRNRRLRATLLIVAMVVIVGAGLALEATHALRTTELSSVDERFKVRGTQPTPSNVVIVAIDDKTFNDLEEHFPFRRRFDARVIRELTKAKPAAIAYDVQFTERTTNEDDARLILAVRAARNVVLATTEVNPASSTIAVMSAYGPAVRRVTPNGRMIHACSIVGGATIPPWTDALAAASSV